MAKLNIDIKNKDIPRLKALLESMYMGEESPFDLSDNGKIITAYENYLKQIIRQSIQGFECEKQKRDFVVVVEDLELN